MSLESLKRSRSSHLGIVTKEKNKYSSMESQDPSTFNVRKLKEAIKRVERKLEELHHTQQLIMECGEEIDEEEEATAVDHFENNVETTIDVIQHLIDLNQVHLAIHDLSRYLDLLSKAKDDFPEWDHTPTINKHNHSYDQLRRLLNQSSVDRDHLLQ